MECFSMLKLWDGGSGLDAWRETARVFGL